MAVSHNSKKYDGYGTRVRYVDNYPARCVVRRITVTKNNIVNDYRWP